MTLFHPADGQVRVKGVTSCPNTVLHGWLKEELTTILRGYRLPDEGERRSGQRRVYRPILPQDGRLPSQVLGLDLNQDGTVDKSEGVPMNKGPLLVRR